MEPDLADVHSLAMEQSFSGVVRVDRDGRTLMATAYGLADRAYHVPNAIDTKFAIASGTKGLTALTVVSLVDDGLLGLDATARSLLGADLPLIDDSVTVEDLLGHRSGIGDYFDEETLDDITDYVLTIPVHTLTSPAQYLPVLDGHPAKFAPGTDFAYCNGGYVVLALLAERATGATFAALVDERVCRPAGMVDTAFLRSDELPPGVARGYLTDTGWRTNIFHLPVLGSGDGGIYTTVADVHRLWAALARAEIVPAHLVREMTRPRSEAPSNDARYGLGFWVHESRDAPFLTGYDAGVSFRSVFDRETGVVHTVIANTSDGAWPLTRLLDELLLS
jgi:CubicO group peptidase (beta-lactamase class C family)